VLPPPAKAGDLHYRAGYALTQNDKQVYRPVVGRSDKRIKWGPGVRSRAEAWSAALAFIDDRS
jgi:hypothetical protein